MMSVEDRNAVHHEQGVVDSDDDEYDDDDDEWRNMSIEERIADIKKRARPEIAADDWAPRNAHELNLDEILGPPLENW